jgi:hypothetical protein
LKSKLLSLIPSAKTVGTLVILAAFVANAAAY